MKSALWDHRASLNLTGYYWKTDDLQLAAVGGTANAVQLVNAQSAIGEGLETSFEVKPIENLLLDLPINGKLTHVLVHPGRDGFMFVIDRQTGQMRSASAQHLFIMTGASPNTNWLQGRLALDDKGVILTGRDLPLAVEPDHGPSWSLPRPPQMLESSLPGVFAVGDVRAGSVKRVASAVGEGAISVCLVHRALAELY